jgi:hypothetical protein
MFCPNCGTQIYEPLKFCKQCGTNLRKVQGALDQSSGGGFDWNKTWVAEILMSEEERERQKGITPEIKRLNEIKGGVITTLVGVGAMVFLRIFLSAVAANEPPDDAEILRNVWLAGLVPFLIGLGLIFNGLFISKRIVELHKQQQMQAPPPPPPLGAPDTGQIAEPAAPPLSGFSVTEPTTTRLQEPVPARSPRDTK